MKKGDIYQTLLHRGTMKRFSIQGLDWNYDRRRGYTTEIEEFTIRVQGHMTNFANANNNWDWLIQVGGVDVAGENDLESREEAVGAALQCIKELCRSTLR